MGVDLSPFWTPIWPPIGKCSREIHGEQLDSPQKASQGQTPVSALWPLLGVPFGPPFGPSEGQIVR